MSIARARTVIGSLYGLMRNALGLNVATPLESQELSCTVAPDRRLVVLGHEPIAGFARDHGTVADDAAMLALHTLDSATLLAEPTFVAPGDSCLRTDDPGWRWHCVAGHGTTLADWERRPLGGALEGLATSGHTHTISDVTGLQAALSDKWGVPNNADTLGMLSSGAGALLYNGAPVGVAGIEITEAPDGPPVASYAHVSDGDANGFIYAIATKFGESAWAAPGVLTPPYEGKVGCMTSNNATGAAFTVDRTSGQNFTTANTASSWMAWDLGVNNEFRPTGYTVRNRGVYDGVALCNWKLQGTNSISAWTVAGLNAATWDDIDVRTNDYTMSNTRDAWAYYECQQPAIGYRFFRIFGSGTNQSGSNYVACEEFEIYGARGQVPQLPSWANTWMTDNAGHYWPAYVTG